MALNNSYSDFLLKLDAEKDRTVYARITALNFQEMPLECIEGLITQGSINIDGTSSVRRTCSLTMVTDSYNYNDYTWSLNTKFKLEVGVKNNIDTNYPDIIWFPQGIYVLTSLNTSKSTNNFTISLQGKDKMCLLNGDVGGSLESSVDFGTIEEENQKGEWVIRKLSIPDIIKNAVHTYGGEPYHNIIINDLVDYGLELLEYRYDAPMYMYRKGENGNEQYSNILLESECLILYDENNHAFTLKTIPEDYFDTMVDGVITEKAKPLYTEQNKQGTAWYFVKIEYGDTAGYRKTELTYAGDLIANIGESITSVLDKIKNMLTEFEYFYNLEGQFIFQKKQSFTSSMWGTSTEQNILSQYNSLSSSTAYTFTNHNSIISFNNNPNLLNMRNDYIIWGERTSTSGAKIPIHYRYAIDNKVTEYKQITVYQSDVDPYNERYGTLLKPQTQPLTYKATTGEYCIDIGQGIVYCDWREILYQMAQDYYKYNYLDDFELRIAAANPTLYPTGQTRYEQYYTDIQGFWRQLFYPDINNKINDLMDEVSILQSAVDANELLLHGTSDNKGIKQHGLISKVSALGKLISDYDAASEENKIAQISSIKTSLKNLISDYPNSGIPITDVQIDNADQDTLMNTQNGLARTIVSKIQTYYKRIEQLLATNKLELKNLTAQLENIKTNADNFYTEGDRIHWCKDVFTAPDALNFWFDFLDQDGVLNQFNVKVVGSRAKAINDTAVKSIYLRRTPPIVFQEASEQIENVGTYKTIQVNNLESMFSIKAQGKSAKERLDELLYQHSYCIESATITTTPIYYLQPNVRIHLTDETTRLNGDYIVSKITLPLAYNGTMSLTATKAVENLL